MNSWVNQQLKSSSTAKAINAYNQITGPRRTLINTLVGSLLSASLYLGVIQPFIDSRDQAVEHYQRALGTHQTFFNEVAPMYPEVPPKAALKQSEMVLTGFAQKLGIAFEDVTSIEGKGVQFSGSNLKFSKLAQWMKQLSDSKISISEYELTKTGTDRVNARFIVY